MGLKLACKDLGTTCPYVAHGETMEELNISNDSINIIGAMDYFVTPYNSIIYTYVGQLKEIVDNPNKDEVDHVFYVPLSFFMENHPEEYEMQLVPEFMEDFPFHLIQGGKNYKFKKRSQIQYFYKYKDYVIWGFTALIIKRFIEIMKTE